MPIAIFILMFPYMKYWCIVDLKPLYSQGYETQMEQLYQRYIQFSSATQNIVPKTLSRKIFFFSTNRYDLTIIFKLIMYKFERFIQSYTINIFKMRDGVYKQLCPCAVTMLSVFIQKIERRRFPNRGKYTLNVNIMY